MVTKKTIDEFLPHIQDLFPGKPVTTTKGDAFILNKESEGKLLLLLIIIKAYTTSNMRQARTKKSLGLRSSKRRKIQMRSLTMPSSCLRLKSTRRNESVRY